MTQHSETRRLPYTPRQMYDLVADVEAYSEFLPWTAAARIRSREDKGDHEILLADLIVSFRVFRERFGSKVVLWPEQSAIDTSYIDGPFKKMDSRWEFREAEGGCDVHFEVDFEFKNRLLQGAAGLFFTEAMNSIVRAFEKRAHQLYG
ncbi:type II toxin-antitoxin system RatA family toxin [Pseudoroseicyclus sp. H15]